MTRRRAVQIISAAAHALAAACIASVATVFVIITAAGYQTEGVIKIAELAVITVLGKLSLTSVFAPWAYVVLFYMLPAALMLTSSVILFSKDSGKQTKFALANAFSLAATAILTASTVMVSLALVQNSSKAAIPFAVTGGVIRIAYAALTIACLCAKPLPLKGHEEDVDDETLVPLGDRLNQAIAAAESDDASVRKMLKLRTLYGDYNALTQDEYVALVGKYLEETSVVGESKQVAEAEREESQTESTSTTVDE